MSSAPQRAGPAPQASFLVILGAEWLAWASQALEYIMASITDLKAAADQLAANESALAAEVGTLTTAVDNLIAKVGTLGSLSPEDQATLDTAVGEVTTAATDLANQTASLTSEQQKAEGA